MHSVDVIAAVGFGKVAIGIVQIPLAACGTGIIARRRLRVHPELSHDARLDIVVMEVAADAELRYLELVRAEDLARTADRVVLRMVEVLNVIDVNPDFRREEL